MLRRNGGSPNLVREKEGAPISAYLTANKEWQETFLRLASVPPSLGSDDTLVVYHNSLCLKPKANL